MLTSINDESTDKSPYTRPQRIEHIEWIKVKFENLLLDKHNLGVVGCTIKVNEIFVISLSILHEKGICICLHNFLCIFSKI